MSVDKRFYKVAVSDHVLTYVNRHPFPIPFKYIKPMGPLNLESSDLKPNPLNGGIEDDGKVYTISEPDEFARRMGDEQNPEDPTRPIHYASKMGQCSFTVLGADSLLFRAPYSELSNGRRVIPFMEITARTFDSPANINMFEIMDVSDEGITQFKYLGDTPLHTVLQGAITVGIRVPENTYWNRMLILRPVANAPALIKGDNNAGINVISCATGALQDAPKPLSDRLETTFDYMSDTSDFSTNLFMDDKYPDLFKGWDTGFIQASTANNSDDPDGLDINLIPGEEEDTPTDTRTTKWFDVTGGDYLWLMPMPLGSISRRCRVQYRTVKGGPNIYKSLRNQSRGYIRVPKNAVEMRIYYKQERDDVEILKIKNSNNLTGVDLSGIDPTNGHWVKAHFNITAPVTFWPGTVYQLQVYTEAGTGETPIGYGRGYRYESGGFNCLFDATPFLNKKTKRFIKD